MHKFSVVKLPRNKIIEHLLPLLLMRLKLTSKKAGEWLKVTQVLYADDELVLPAHVGIGRRDEPEKEVVAEVIEGDALKDLFIAKVTLPDSEIDLIFQQYFCFQISICNTEKSTSLKLLGD